MRADHIATLMLGLQRTAGNRAVCRTFAADRRVLARYESPEHVDIGDRYSAQLAGWIVTDEGKAWARKYGLEADVVGLETDWYALGQRKIGHGPQTLSPGEIIALSGDFYETWADLATAPREEVGQILTAIHLEREGRLENANARYEEITKSYRSDSRQHYLELAKRNTPHFTPGNRERWRSMHVEALALAGQQTSGPGVFTAARFGDQGAAHDDEFEKALFIDAAAGHFLTDAFASGHLFNKDQLDAAITSYLREHTPQPANPEMGAYYGLMDVAGVTPQLVLKNIHDRLNREGLDVTNERGMTWRTYGDQFLAKAEDTQRIAALAIYVSRRQVYQARALQHPNPDDVLRFLPDSGSIEKATEIAKSYIPRAVGEIGSLIYRQRGMAPTQFGSILGGVIESNIQTIASPGRERQLVEIQERAQRTGQPQPVPQFTIATW
jgi:hypothetical protein